jgi:hypothetical protein
MPSPGDRGSSWVAVQLDTTAPALVFGATAKYEGIVGDTLVVPFTTNEPATVGSAVLRVGTTDYPVTVTGSGTSFSASFVLPVEGAASLRINVSDDVKNARTYTHAVTVNAAQRSWFTVELDTTPPKITWAQSSYAVDAGDTLSVAFTLDEPDVVQATLRIGVQDFPMIVDYDDNLGYIASIQATTSGTGLVVVRVMDDVDNIADYSVPVQVGDVITPPPPPPPPVAPYVPGAYESVVQRHEDRYEGEFLATAKVTDRVTGMFIAVDKQRVSAEFGVVARTEDRVAGSLSLSLRMATIRREDDELLLLI